MPINENNLTKTLNRNGESATPKQENNLFQEILEINKENNRLLKRVVRYQRMETLFGLLKILVVIVPLILAYIYLTPMLSQVIKNYQSALGTVEELQSATAGLKGLENVDLNKQLKEMQELFK